MGQSQTLQVEGSTGESGLISLHLELPYNTMREAGSGGGGGEGSGLARGLEQGEGFSSIRFC